MPRKPHRRAPKAPPATNHAPVLDVELAATAVALSGLYGCQRAADLVGIDVSTVKGYRQRVFGNAELLQRVEERRRVLEGEWASKMNAAKMGAVDFILRATQEADASDPEVIHAVAGALKMLTECEGFRMMLDVRLAAARQHHVDAGPPRLPGPVGAVDGSDAPAAAVEAGGSAH